MSHLTEPLDVGEYTTTEAFRKIDAHTCVCKHDGSLVAVTGPAGDAESIDYALLFAAAPKLVKALDRLVESIETEGLCHGDACGCEFCDDYKGAKRIVKQLESEASHV